MNRQFEIVLSLITLSLILSFMEFPWSAVGVIFSAITLAVLLGYNIPKFIKSTYEPKIGIDLYIYPEKTCKQQGVIQSDEGKIFEKEIEVLPNISPQFFVRIKPQWEYKVNCNRSYRLFKIENKKNQPFC